MTCSASVSKNQTYSCTCRRATFINILNASLTASASGNASCTSDSSKIRFVPARYRSTYLPRTLPFNFERSYSGRISSSKFSVLFLLIRFSLCAGRFPRADDANCFAVVGVRNEQQSALFGMPDNQKSPFFVGMIRVVKRIGKQVAENRCGFLKRNIMFREIARRFVFSPVKPPPKI